MIEDEYGPRLVDETNNVILVKDGDTWRPAESANFSEEFPAAYWETKIGESDGFAIPITVGLSANVREGVDFTYSKVHMTQEGADDVAQVYLHYAWGRYKDIMGHGDITYEEYLNLLREGKGNIEILDSITHERIMLDPRQGMSMVITGDETRNMPLKYYTADGFNFSANEKGRLLYAINTAYSAYHTLNNFNVSTKDYYFVYISFEGSSLIALAANKCMRDSVNANCGTLVAPSYLTNVNFDIFKHLSDYHNGLSSTPLFTLE